MKILAVTGALVGLFLCSVAFLVGMVTGDQIKQRELYEVTNER